MTIYYEKQCAVIQLSSCQNCSFAEVAEQDAIKSELERVTGFAAFSQVVQTYFTTFFLFYFEMHQSRSDLHKY